MIEKYAQIFPVFPLNGKIPLVKSWQTTELNPQISRQEIPGNYGVVLPLQVMVIDVDVRDNRPGKQSYHQLLNDLGLNKGWELGTFVVRTGSGGFHVYLSKPADIRIKKNLSVYPSLDFLSAGHFVVGADSVHPDTHKPYEVICGDPSVLLPAPDKLLAILEHHTTAKIGESFVDDGEENIARFKDIIARYPSDIIEGGRNVQTFSIAAKGRDIGLSMGLCSDMVIEHFNSKCVPPLPAEEVQTIVTNVYKYAKNTQGVLNPSIIFDSVDTAETDLDNYTWNRGPSKDEKRPGPLLKTLHNCIGHVLAVCPKALRYNLFTNGMEVTASAAWWKQRGYYGPHFIEPDVIMIKEQISEAVNVEYPTAMVREACIVVSRRKHYHPVQNYLNALTWDGTARIDTWLTDYLGVQNNKYTQEVGRKLLCAAVNRVFNPGCKFDFLTILEGEQGIGKSTAIRTLAKDWFCDMDLDAGNKDMINVMFGKWIIELNELAGMSFAKMNSVKSFISRQTDTARLAYDSAARDYSRQSVFIGTINPSGGYLSDDTGNRRFWVLHCKKVDIIGLEKAVDQLWAEAMEAYKDEKLYLSPEASVLQVRETNARRPEDSYLSLVRDFLDAHPAVDEATAIQVFAFAGRSAANVNIGDQQRIARIFRDLGWGSKHNSINGTNERYFTRPISEIVSREMGDL